MNQKRDRNGQFKSELPPLSIDDMLGLPDELPRLQIRPAAWWITSPDAQNKETLLAAWEKGRDFQIVRGPMLSRNESRMGTAVFYSIINGEEFEYPNYPADSEAVYYHPPRKVGHDSDL